MRLGIGGSVVVAVLLCVALHLDFIVLVASFIYVIYAVIMGYRSALRQNESTAGRPDANQKPQ